MEAAEEQQEGPECCGLVEGACARKGMTVVLAVGKASALCGVCAAWWRRSVQQMRLRYLRLALQVP